MCSQYSFILEDDEGICGYVVAAPDAADFHQKMSVSWLPEMREKYPFDMSLEEDKMTPLQVSGRVNDISTPMINMSFWCAMT